MADRSSRSSVDLSRVTQSGSRVQSRVVPRPTPEIIPATQGLEGLRLAFSEFGGALSSAANTIGEAEQRARLADIENENRRQEALAQQDAFSAQGLTRDNYRSFVREDMDDDLDYTTAFEITVGSRLGAQMVQEARSQLSALPPGQDPRAALEGFLASQWGGGTDSEIVNATALRSFWEGVEPAIAEQYDRTSSYQIAQGVYSLQGEISEVIRGGGTIDADQIVEWTDRLRVLDPEHAANAPIAIANTILSVAPDDAMSINRVMDVLSSPGSGVNGQSFFESFPETRRMISEGLTQNYRNTAEWDAEQAYNNLEDMFREAEASGDIDTLARIGVLLETTRNTYGGYSRYSSLSGRLATALEGVAEVQVGVNQVGEMLYGDMTWDQSVVQEYQGRYIQAVGGAIFSDDPSQQIAAARIVADSNFLNTDDRAALARRLSPVSRFSPQERAQAFRFYESLQGIMGNERAAMLGSEFMDDETARFYNLISRAAALSEQSLEEIFARYDPLQRVDEQARRTTFAEITPDNDTDVEARRKIDGEIIGAINDHFGEEGLFGIDLLGGEDPDVIIPPDVMDMLRDQFRVDLIQIGQGNSDDWREIAQNVGETAASRLAVAPAADGRNRVWINRMAPTVYGTDTPTVRLGTQVFNSDMGTVENTLETSRTDLTHLAESLPETLSASGLELRPTQPELGLYEVSDRGRPVVFAVGETYAFGEGDTRTEFQLPADGTLASQIIDTNLGSEHFYLVPWPSASDAQAYFLHYEPHFRSLEDIARDYSRPQTFGDRMWHNDVLGEPLPPRVDDTVRVDPGGRTQREVAEISLNPEADLADLSDNELEWSHRRLSRWMVEFTNDSETDLNELNQMRSALNNLEAEVARRRDRRWSPRR